MMEQYTLALQQTNLNLLFIQSKLKKEVKKLQHIPLLVMSKLSTTLLVSQPLISLTIQEQPLVQAQMPMVMVLPGLPPLEVSLTQLVLQMLPQSMTSIPLMEPSFFQTEILTKMKLPVMEISLQPLLLLMEHGLKLSLILQELQ